jgi:hypothetical protein
VTESDAGPVEPPADLASVAESTVSDSTVSESTLAEASDPDFGQQSLLPPATTGEPRVDAALAHLSDLAEQPVAEHVAAFERVHAALADALSDQPGAD